MDLFISLENPASVFPVVVVAAVQWWVFCLVFVFLFCCSVVKLSDSLSPHGLQHARLPVFHYLQSLLKLISIESVMLSNHLILCCPLLLLPSIFPNIRVISNELAVCIRWSRYWNFYFFQQQFFR